jgi:hypothetical protein
MLGRRLHGHYPASDLGPDRRECVLVMSTAVRIGKARSRSRSDLPRLSALPPLSEGEPTLRGRHQSGPHREKRCQDEGQVKDLGVRAAPDFLSTTEGNR